MASMAVARAAGVALAGVGALLAGASGARAELGGRASSIATDRVHMNAHIASAGARATGSYVATPMTPESGGTVTEYANADGTVFAVSWHGPGRPDLRQLLGTHFATYQAVVAATPGRRTRRRLVIARSDLVVQSSGHPGAFAGVAYIPALVPAGFTSDDLQ